MLLSKVPEDVCLDMCQAGFISFQIGNHRQYKKRLATSLVTLYMSMLRITLIAYGPN